MGQSSLLERMRAGSDSTVMQVLIALVMLSFLGWYGKPKGEQNHTIAKVNGERILDTDYFRQVRLAQRNTEAQSGRTLSDAEEKQLAEQVKSQMIEDLVVLGEAHRLGLEVSGSEVARELLKYEFLKNKEGKFDKELYESFLKRQQMTQAQFEQRLMDDLLRLKLRELVFMGANVSEPSIQAAWKSAATKINIQYVRIRPTLFDDEVTITPDQVTAWLKENEGLAKEQYTKIGRAHV